MIEVRHLTKRYGPHLAISDLNFSIEAGRVYGFLGPNGAGKSTTMNIIMMMKNIAAITTTRKKNMMRKNAAVVAMIITIMNITIITTIMDTMRMKYSHQSVLKQ